LVFLARLPAAAEDTSFTVENYWQLTKLRLELSAIEWQERITSAEQAKGDRKMLISRSDAIRKQYAGYHRQLHSKFGTTPRDYLHFATDHARELEPYLEEHPDMKREIEDVRQKVLGLMQRFDSLAEPALNGGTAK
jgi:hypothetical protein